MQLPQSVIHGKQYSTVWPQQVAGVLNPSTDDFYGKVILSEKARMVEARKYKESRLGQTARVVVELPDGTQEAYFVKIVTVGQVGKIMCKGEYESLSAIHEVTPRFTTKPIAWGACADHAADAYFLITEFRAIGHQPAGPVELASGLADLHVRSFSPTGMFGFHVKTCHGPIVQDINHWEKCWATFFGRHLKRYMDTAGPKMTAFPVFDSLCRMVLDIIVPRLLLPLQTEGRTIKPSLIHGDCWDGNTGIDAATGQAFIFDACSFYGHHEYDIGNWIAPRHKLSDKAYFERYQDLVPVSEPIEDLSSRLTLYSLPFNLGNIVNVPDSTQQDV